MEVMEIFLWAVVHATACIPSYPLF